MKRLLFAVLVFLPLLLPGVAQSATGPVVISEFMAANSTALRDDFQEYADWIEIYNASSTPVNLLNWGLTDVLGDPTPWRFPATNLNAGAFMIIYASERNRRVAGAALHTDFRLARDGEYLALVRPDNTVASEFPAGVAQFTDVSYGFSTEQTSFIALATNGSARVLIPSSAPLDTTWQLPEFNDTSWIEATNGIGFDTGLNDPSESSYVGAVLQSAPLTYWRLAETSGTSAANLGSLGAAANATYQNTPTLGAVGPRPPQFGGFESDNRAVQLGVSADFVGGPTGLLNNRSSFTMAGWIRPTATQNARTGLFGQNDLVEFGFISATGLQLWTFVGSIDLPYPYPINEWHHIACVGTPTRLDIFIDGTLRATTTTSGGIGTSTFNFNIGGGGVFDATGNDFQGQIDEVSVWGRALAAAEIAALIQGSSSGSVDFNPAIATDIRAAMHNVNASAFVRLPFVVTNAAEIDRLTLRMKYDDGFVAYLNGIEVARRNSPETNEWNSTATGRHADNLALQFEEFEATPALAALTVGTNILAVHGLNIHPTNTDFYVQAELVATSVGEMGTVARYFVVPTPGGPNGVGTSDLGPIVFGSSSTPTLPGDNDTINVTARIVPAKAPISSVRLNWRVMFGITNNVEMVHTGNGIYSASIPASASTNGQMVRWYITASDSQSRTSRWPLFDNPTESPEYLGTMIADTTLQSLLPVVHTFVESAAGADARTGTRCSIFYLGEFYDNVFMGLHGQSSAGFPKKSYNLDFNTDQRFRYKPGSPRVKDIKFLQNWGDKAKLRNTLGYEFMGLSGSVSHFSFQVRVQRNAQFFQVCDIVEDADELWLERVGLNPEGALYKIYNNLGAAGGNEKKTRKTEDSSDLQTLITNIDEARPMSNRVTYAYDNIDLPQTVSYLVACALISHQDHGHKNLYAYRDTGETGEWTMFPWDVDLDWGRNWIDANGYFTDTLYQTNTLTFYNAAQQGKGANRFYELMYDHTQFRQMYLRRLRTVMETILQPPGTTTNQGGIEARIFQMAELIDPPSVAQSDADLDFARWGSWGNNNQMRPEMMRIVDIHLPGRRDFLFNNTNAAVNGERVPPPTPALANILIGAIEANPSSGNQAEEFIQLVNPNGFAIDLSGWKLDGAVQFTFRPGTVMVSNSVLYLSPNVPAFRARATGPRAGQNLFVQGRYDGQLNARGETLLLYNSKGRLVHTNAYPGNPSLAQQYLRVTEIMYHPSPRAGNPTDPDEYEYIELKNIGPVALNLNGVHFTNGIDFNFTGSAVTSLAAGASVLVVKNAAAFAARYGGGFSIAGQYVGSLDNSGEEIRLDDAVGEKILEFSYNNSWYPITDGLGFSLAIVDASAPWDSWDKKASWRPSGLIGGSPGQNDPAPPVIAPILVNEVLTHTDLPAIDTIELYNPTASDVNIGGWYITDDNTNAFKFRIPNGTTIGAGGYLLFDEDDFNAAGSSNAFAFSSKGDEVYLYSADANTNLTGYLHGFNFGAAETGVPFGRHLTSEGAEHFVAQVTPTLGATNSGPRVGPIVFSEIFYHPLDLSGGEDNSLDEFLELRNITGATVSLFDPAFPTNRWRLRGGADFDFPTNITLAAGSHLLLVNFNPTNAPALADFRSRFGVAPTVQVLGPYAGKLDNSSDTVRLLKPDAPDLGEIPYVLVEEVSYKDSSPWPSAGDGVGASLQRFDLSKYGNDPVNWVAALPTSGQGYIGGTAPTITAHPANVTTLASLSAVFNVSATGAAPLRYQWSFNGSAIPQATNSVLALHNLDIAQAGNYRVTVFNGAGSAVSTEATLIINVPADIFSHPQSVTLRGSTNAVDYGSTTNRSATFTVSAVGSGQVNYQWRFNGVPIAGQTGSTLTVPNVTLAHDGLYDAAISDEVGTIFSNPARLTVLVTPTFLEYPQNVTVAAGSDFSASVEMRGNPTPFAYSWRRNSGSLVIATNSHNSRSDFITLNTTSKGLILTNGIVASNFLMRIVVYNDANRAPGVTTQFTVTVLADSDQDGIPDVTELALGLATNNAADANGDLDLDGMSNRAEHIAGTDPTNSLSYLKVEGDFTSGGAQIRFGAISNRTYSVEYSRDLGTPTWSKLGDVVARPQNRTETIPDPNYTTNRFYRVVTPQRP